MYLGGSQKEKSRDGLIETSSISGERVSTDSSGTYVAIVGPTASGKSRAALRLAQDLNGEIVNCDSIQVYQGFDIGSAKPNPVDRRLVRHHLIDIAEWHQPFDAASYRQEARRAIGQILSSGKIPIVVGGTGLYLRSLWGYDFHDLPVSLPLREQLKPCSTRQLRLELEHLDPDRAADIHPTDRVRNLRAVECCRLLGMPVSKILAKKPSDLMPPHMVIYVNPPKDVLRDRISRRTQELIDDGLVEETRSLLSKGVSEHCKPMQSIGYKEACSLVTKGEKLSALAEQINQSTTRYAKQQRTWFKKLPFAWETENIDEKQCKILSRILQNKESNLAFKAE